MADYTSQPVDIFENLKFVIIGFNAERCADLKQHIEDLAGSVVPRTYNGVPDYAVVPTFGTQLHYTATEVVNELWITECYTEQKICEVAYYHQPLVLHNNAVLKSCVITLSGYSGYERNFLRFGFYSYFICCIGQ